MNLNLNRSKRFSRVVRSAFFVGGLLSVGAVGSGLLTSCNDGYNLAKEDPDWLGSSIYNYLESQGNYTVTTRLIDELGYTSVLAKTGSNTLFVADDAAYQRFFASDNPWKVKRVEDLSTTQKKLLLFGGLIKNACQVAYLSSREGKEEPVEGDCMRRKTTTTEYDTIPVLDPSLLPDNPYWNYYRNNNKTITCAYDLTATPMVHFTQAFLETNLITAEDCKFFTNNRGGEYNMSDAFINGVKIEDQNIKCSNGFIHKMAEVITPLPNMAQLINQTPETSEFASLLERFSAPYEAGDEATIEYNRLYHTNIDSLFQKRYFSKRSQKGVENIETPQHGPVPATLKFDPGWNQYFSETTASTSQDIAMKENMAVMLVPTNEALTNYFENSPLKTRYHEWKNVPDQVVAKLINVNMLNSFTETVPSKFKNVLNDANDEMNLEVDKIKEVKMACNGALYITTKVYNPVAYNSVSFPALINENMAIINWAIDQLKFDVYLNSQQSEYSFFIPDSAALLSYLDPCSLGKPSRQLYQFHYDRNAVSEQEKVWAAIYNYDEETGQIGDSIGEADYNQIINRLEDILDNHIVIGDVRSGNTYYQTKGGALVRVKEPLLEKNGMKVQGGYQKETQKKDIQVTDYYDFTQEGGNGHTYILSDQPLLTSDKSVYDILSERDDFSAFRELLEGSDYLEDGVHKLASKVYGSPRRNISLFNTFRYTVYVPTNKAIKDLQNAGKLPTWEMVDAEEDEDVKDSLKNEIDLFLKYHIQDNSMCIGAGDQSGDFETSAYTIVDGNLQYYKLNVHATNDEIVIRDRMGNEHKVEKSKGLYNLMSREYMFEEGSSAITARNLYTSSYAVVHQIDGVLNYK